jgi:hypothetical protein
VALSSDEVVRVAKRLREIFDAEQYRLDRIDEYLRGKHDGPYQPREAGSEYRKLVARSVTPMLPLVVTVKAQALFVEGYRSRGSSDTVAWEMWQANGWDRRQSAVHRAALNYGCCYATVLPGDPLPVMRGVSPRQMVTGYSDPAEDDWPDFALRVYPSSGSNRRMKLYDDTSVYDVVETSQGMTSGAVSVHDAGVCPVVRYCSDLDLEGRSRGLVEPLMVMQDRLDQTVFDLLMTQTYASWKVRTVAGMAIAPDLTAEQQAELTDEQVRARKVKLSQDRFLAAEDPDTKFGTLDETPLDGFISAVELAGRHIATVSQTPPHHLLGQMVNLSAEALAAAEAGHDRQVEELKHSFGESHEQTLRLGSSLAGDAEGAEDVSSQVVWRDMESRSLAQYADAYGKMAAQLGFPPEILWEKIPGFTQEDIARARDLGPQTDALAQIAAGLNRQQVAAA